eukprot:EG_transcript_8984
MALPRPCGAGWAALLPALLLSLGLGLGLGLAAPHPGVALHVARPATHRLPPPTAPPAGPRARTGGVAGVAGGPPQVRSSSFPLQLSSAGGDVPAEPSQPQLFFLRPTHLLPLLGASLAFVASYLFAGRGLPTSTPGPTEETPQWSMCASKGKKKKKKRLPKGTMPPKPPPVAPDQPRKFGKRRQARLTRHYQKWTFKIKTSLRDTVNALELFARDGDVDRYVQMRYHFQLVFEQMYLKARVNGCLPYSPKPKRRTIFGRLFTFCFYQLDENGKPTSPYKEAPQPEPDTSDSDDQLDFKDIMKLNKVQRRAERKRRNERKKARAKLSLNQRKWLVLQKLRPPLPQYKEWLSKLKYELRQVPRAVEAFIRVNRNINYRLMRDTLWQVSDTMDLMWPPGLYWHSLVPRHKLSPRGPMSDVTGPYCGWAIIPDNPLLLDSDDEEEPVFPVAMPRIVKKKFRKRARSKPLFADPVMPENERGEFNPNWNAQQAMGEGEKDWRVLL